MLRPDGVVGPLTMRAAGRDLLTRGGDAVEVDRVSLHAEVDYVGGRTLTAIGTDPPRPELDALRGERVSSGFRARIDAAAPRLRGSGSVLFQLLDDLPVAALVSGYAFGAAGVVFPGQAARYRPQADLCAGWRSGGTIMVEVERSGMPPLVTGPAAPALADPDDPQAWHRVEPLPAHGMRRARRLDVWLEPSGVIAADSLFRDSHVDVDGVETVVHEYSVAVSVDPGRLTVVDVVATPRTLPWVECPVAADSARRLLDVPVTDLRDVVRSELTGTSTCTHLNDQLRSLADVPALVQRLATPGGPA